MSQAKVSIVRAVDYGGAGVDVAVEEAVELVGGLEHVVKPGSRVFVKINHLSPASPPERGIITHPAFVEAVLKLLRRTGARVTVGDDIDSSNGDGFQVSSFRQMCQRAGVALVNLREAGFVEARCQGRFLEKVYVSRIAADADVIVNLPKLKTHSLTVLTGGVKNMYGVIPCGLRTRFHGDYAAREDFAQVLTDIFSAARPQLTIMDGVVAMEGEGPAAGKLRRLGVILASRDAVALDAVAAGIIGLDPTDILTTRYASERGLGVGRLQDIEVAGERIEDVAVPDFRIPLSGTAVLVGKAPRFLVSSVSAQLSPRPRLIEQRCTGCFECVRSCPAGAISARGRMVEIDQGICIRCMCCHEVCRFDAIEPAWSPAGSVLHWLIAIWRKITAPSP